MKKHFFCGCTELITDGAGVYWGIHYKAKSKTMEIGIWPSQLLLVGFRKQRYHWNRTKTAILGQAKAKMWGKFLYSNFSNQILGFGCNQGCVIFDSQNENIQKTWKIKIKTILVFSVPRIIQNISKNGFNWLFQINTVYFCHIFTLNDWKPEVNCWKA